MHASFCAVVQKGISSFMKPYVEELGHEFFRCIFHLFFFVTIEFCYCQVKADISTTDGCEGTVPLTSAASFLCIKTYADLSFSSILTADSCFHSSYQRREANILSQSRTSRPLRYHTYLLSLARSNFSLVKMLKHHSNPCQL